MPPRHISPQSFDDILSELGDDPAIPDPHGIRKSPPPHKADSAPQTKVSKPSFLAQSFDLNRPNLSPIWILGAILLICGGGLFFYFDPNKSDSEGEISNLQNQLLALKEELELSQSEWASEKEDLYQLIDEIEVSIHSLKENQGKTKAAYKPQTLPHETEIRRWRYLGHSQMGDTKRAFFQTDKGNATFEKGTSVLGEWHLTHIEKSSASITHPQGKSLTLKAFKSE